MGEDGPAFSHYSTGRLTLTQAQLVDGWRRRLQEDRPLSDQDGERQPGLDDRPRASSSDIIAACVADLLSDPPSESRLVRFAESGRLAVGEGMDGVAIYPPVDYYLPREFAARLEELRSRAWGWTLGIERDAREEMRRRYPGRNQAPARAAALMEVMRQRCGLARPGVRQVPRGAVARMAIDRWGARPADEAVAAAVAYAAAVHVQPHRVRRDMRTMPR